VNQCAKKLNMIKQKIILLFYSHVHLLMLKADGKLSAGYSYNTVLKTVIFIRPLDSLIKLNTTKKVNNKKN
jgi:hypothetical protein